jgi:hypothetical protein
MAKFGALCFASPGTVTSVLSLSRALPKATTMYSAKMGHYDGSSAPFHGYYQDRWRVDRLRQDRPERW